MKAIDTKEIHRKIAAAYHRNATLDSSAIQIDTSGSKVTLRGKVKSWMEKKEAENIAWRAAGVLSVENKIDIDAEVLV